MSTTMHKRRWYQFSLGTLLVVMTVSTVAFGGWVHYRQYRALQKQKEETAAWLHSRRHRLDSGRPRNHHMDPSFYENAKTPKQDSPQCEILP